MRCFADLFKFLSAVAVRLKAPSKNNHYKASYARTQHLHWNHFEPMQLLKSVYRSTRIPILPISPSARAKIRNLIIYRNLKTPLTRGRINFIIIYFSSERVVYTIVYDGDALEANPTYSPADQNAAIEVLNNDVKAVRLRVFCWEYFLCFLRPFLCWGTCSHA